MNYRKICLRAEELGIKRSYGLKKGEVIRSIQLVE